MNLYFLRCALPKGNWKSPYVSMVTGAKQGGAIPSNFIWKPIPSGEKIANYFLTGKSVQRWDLISPYSTIFPIQALISQKIHDILLEHRLPEIYFGDLEVFDSNISNAVPYKLINIVASESFSIIDFEASDVRAFSDVSHDYESIEVLNQDDFLKKSGNFFRISLKRELLPNLDFFTIKNVSGWIISEKLAQRLVEENISGLFGFPLTEQAIIYVSRLYKENDNFFVQKK